MEDHQFESAMQMIDGRDAEIERLRAALKPFAELGNDGVPNQAWIDNAKVVLEQKVD